MFFDSVTREKKRPGQFHLLKTQNKLQGLVSRAWGKVASGSSMLLRLMQGCEVCGPEADVRFFKKREADIPQISRRIL